MPLKVSDGIGAYIDDFQKSDAPQFKGKDKKERRDMAIAAYLTVKRGGKAQDENVKTADRKPEVYTKPDGRKGVRMVPTDREVIKKESVYDPNNHNHVKAAIHNTKNSVEGIAAIKKKFGVDHKKASNMLDKAIDRITKNESVDELSMYTSKKLPNLSYPKKKTKYQQEKDRINMMKKNKQKDEEVNELKTSTINSYAKKSKASTDRATNSAVATILRKGDHSKDLNTMRKREKGMELAKSRSIAKLRKNKQKGESVEEKYTDKQRIMRDMGRNQPSDPSGALKKKISQDARNISKYMKGSPVRPKDLARRATGGEGGHEMERGIKKRKVGGAKNPDYAPVSQDKLARKSEGMKEEMNFAVTIDGLPTMFMSADSPGMLKQTLRKIVKQPSMIKAVKRVTDAKVKKTFRLKAQGKEEESEE